MNWAVWIFSCCQDSAYVIWPSGVRDRFERGVWLWSSFYHGYQPNKQRLTHLCQKLSKFQQYICQNQRGHRVSVTSFGLFSLWLYWSGQKHLNSIFHLFLIFFSIWHLVTFPNLCFKAVFQLFWRAVHKAFKATM